ncbi:hypothetical protein AAFF_G00427060 [Aldrovandia affinis]|uniref:CRAL-TRIO domain-containing protein n=1 Tax=Aldrovandia affinis TaxID=143900 RepID=A0AAD7SBU0_9TELE|nr:hypothetical protein AAFF_G00427060 [Aldrovandia affinis]
MDEYMPVTMNKDEFLANNTNKQQFINMLSGHLQKKNCQTYHAPDLLILLIYHANLKSHNLFFTPEPKKSTKKPRVWNIKAVNQQLGPSVCTHILFIHAIAGCDTTSRLYGIGKGAPLKKFTTSSEFREQATVFDTQSASTAEVVSAGENALLCLYNGKPGEGLDSLRHKRFCEKVATSTSHVQPQSLPPTSAAAKYHSLRVYYQVQQWKGTVDELLPQEWGWKESDGGLVPVQTDLPPAPLELLRVIRCTCKTDCSSLRIYRSLVNMECFLHSCRSALKGIPEKSPGLHIVLGNEACDLDSMVSSLAFAYFLSKNSGYGKTPVPVLNIPRAEFPLHTDNGFLLRESGLTQDALVFRDEVDLLGLHRAGKLALTLVDHNVLPSADSDLEGAVVEVIDHHQLERVPSPSCPVTVETVGSCATLVTERIMQKAPEVLDRQVAQLLYGTIIMDCVNMAPEAEKVTPKDSKYAVLLESRFPDLPPRGALFQSLQNAKFDISGLTTEQMLLKDLKVASGADLKLAVSVVYMTLEAFLQRRGLQQELCEFCHKHSYSLVIAMTISLNKKKEPFRQLAVYSSNPLYREEMSQALEEANNPCLNLSPMCSPLTEVKAYLQGNTVASRKKVMPIIKDFLVDRGRRAVHCGDLEDLGELEEDHSRPRYHTASQHRWRATEDPGMEEGSCVPPTPMNSLVEGCPLDSGLPRMSAEAVLERFREVTVEEGMEHRPQHGQAAQVRPANREQLWQASVKCGKTCRDREVSAMGTYTDQRDQYMLNGGPEGTKTLPNFQDMELREEWQDEEFPRPLPEDAHDPEDDTPAANGDRPMPPSSLALSGSQPRKKRLVAPTLSLTLDKSDSMISDDFAAAALSATPEDDTELDINLEALETPSDSESCNFPESMHDLEWEDDLPRMGRGEDGAVSTPVMEQTDMDLDQVDSKGRRWRRFRIAGQECQVNMSVLEPYLQVLSHGGYYGDGMNAIIVFSSCYLPENSVENYEYVMENLFRYIVGTLDLMVSENYVMVYLCGMAPRSKMPAIKWLRQCYLTVDRRLRKDMKALFVVHPTWYIKALITIIKPFISVKFSRKVRFIDSLLELQEYIPMEHVQIPDCIQQFDEKMNSGSGQEPGESTCLRHWYS